MSEKPESTRFQRALDFYTDSIKEDEVKGFIKKLNLEKEEADQLWEELKSHIIREDVKRVNLDKDEQSTLTCCKEACAPCILCCACCCGMFCFCCCFPFLKMYMKYFKKKSILSPPKSKKKQAIEPKVEFVPLNYEEEKKRCLDSGTLFEDPQFDADFKNIFLNKTTGKDLIKWKRPGEIVKKPKFFTDGHSRFDVKQGGLGDCWLLAGLASLTLNDELFYKVVPEQTFEDGYAGIFHFKFWRYGEWVDVVIDDRLPTLRGKLCFMSSTDKNEFWTALLEKAVAKLFGSYEHLEGGVKNEAFRLFCGGFGAMYVLPMMSEEEQEQLFDSISHSLPKGSMYGCSIIPTEEGKDDSVKRRNGLFYAHAYTVTGAGVFKVKGIEKEYRLVRVRNPHGEGEWIGDFADNSFFWDHIEGDPENHAKEDGEFWLPWCDFLKNFNLLEEMHIKPEDAFQFFLFKRELEDNEKSITETIFHGNWSSETSGGLYDDVDTFHNNPQYLVTASDAEFTPSIVINLLPKFLREKALSDDYDLHGTSGFIYLFKLDKSSEKLTADNRDDFTLIDSFSQELFLRDRTLQHQLLPGGRYLVVVTMEAKGKLGDFVLRFYTNSEMDIKQL